MCYFEIDVEVDVIHGMSLALRKCRYNFGGGGGEVPRNNTILFAFV